VECLARALGDQVSEPTGGASGHGPDEGEELANTAKEVLGHYERTNRASGKAREAVVKLVRIRDARIAREQGLPERALEVSRRPQKLFLEADKRYCIDYGIDRNIPD